MTSTSFLLYSNNFLCVCLDVGRIFLKFHSNVYHIILLVNIITITIHLSMGLLLGQADLSISICNFCLVSCQASRQLTANYDQTLKLILSTRDHLFHSKCCFLFYAWASSKGPNSLPYRLTILRIFKKRHIKMQFSKVPIKNHESWV
jgi:hypothetical protein